MPETPQATPGRGALDRALVSGFQWNALGRIAGQLLAWSSTFVVVRLLTPEDYGIVAMGGVVFGLAALIGDGGIGGAILNRREDREEHLGQLTSISVVLGLAATIITLALAWPVAGYFRDPRLVVVIAVASVAYVVLGFRSVPLAVLQRDLAFKTLARNDFLMVATGAVTAIGLALAGFAYWALILAPIAGATVATIAAWQARPQRLRMPNFPELRETLAFGLHLMVSRIATYIGGQTDSLIVGRVLGKPALGNLRVAGDVAGIPIDRVAGLLLQVSGPVLAAANRDRDALARYLFRITELVALVAWPATIGLALVADQLVVVVLGVQWEQAIGPLVVLAISGTVRSVTPLLSGVVVASGDARLTGRVSAGSTILSIVLMLALVRQGLVALALVAATSNAVVFVLLLRRTLMMLGQPLSAYFTALIPAGASCAAMTAVVLGVQSVLPGDGVSVGQLGATVSAGAGAYLLVLLGAFGGRVRSALRAIRRARTPEAAV